MGYTRAVANGVPMPQQVRRPEDFHIPEIKIHYFTKLVKYHLRSENKVSLTERQHYLQRCCTVSVKETTAQSIGIAGARSADGPEVGIGGAACTEKKLV